MAYIGKQPETKFSAAAKIDRFTGDGSTTAFDLANIVPSGGENSLMVYIDNVRQEPGSSKAFTIGNDGSGDLKRVTFTSAPASSASIYVITPFEATTMAGPADGTISTAKIIDANVTTAKIAADAITGAKIADDAINSEHYTDGSIDTAHIADSQVTTAKIADDAITSAKIADSVSFGTAWQAVVTGNTTMVAGRGYFVNTTSGAVTMTLPSSATIGDTIQVIDYAATADTNNITIGRNSHKIQGDAADLVVTTERAAFALVYVDATQGWLLDSK
jgi:hypothetical protein